MTSLVRQHTVKNMILSLAVLHRYIRDSEGREFHQGSRGNGTVMGQNHNFITVIKRILGHLIDFLNCSRENFYALSIRVILRYYMRNNA